MRSVKHHCCLFTLGFYQPLPKRCWLFVATGLQVLVLVQWPDPLCLELFGSSPECRLLESMSGIMLEPYIHISCQIIVTSLWPHCNLTGIMLRIRGIIPKWPYFSLKSWGKCELYWTYQCYIGIGHRNHCNPHSIHIQTYIMWVKL